MDFRKRHLPATKQRKVSRFDEQYYKACGLYAVTISPPDRVSRYQSLMDVYNADFSDYRLLLRKCCKHFAIYPELDRVGRLHYHGVIKIYDWIKWHKSVKPSLANRGFLCVKPLDTYFDHLNWVMYCLKEFSMTRFILGKRNKPLNEMLMPIHIERSRIYDDSPGDGISGSIEEFLWLDSHDQTDSDNDFNEIE